MGSERASKEVGPGGATSLCGEAFPTGTWQQMGRASATEGEAYRAGWWPVVRTEMYGGAAWPRLGGGGMGKRHAIDRRHF